MEVILVSPTEEAELVKELTEKGIDEETVNKYFFVVNERGTSVLVSAVEQGAPLSTESPPPLGFFLLKERFDEESVTVAEILALQGRWDEIPKERTILEIKDRKGVPIGLKMAKEKKLTWDDVIGNPDVALIADEMGWTVAHQVAHEEKLTLEKARNVPFFVLKAHTNSGWAVVHEAIINDGSLIDDLNALSVIEPIHGKSAFTLGLENNSAFFDYVQRNAHKFSDVVCFFDKENHRLVKFKEVLKGVTGIKLLLRR